MIYYIKCAFALVLSLIIFSSIGCAVNVSNDAPISGELNNVYLNEQDDYLYANNVIYERYGFFDKEIIYEDVVGDGFLYLNDIYGIATELNINTEPIRYRGCVYCNTYNVTRWEHLVSEYFNDEDIDWALSVIFCESTGDPDALNVSSNASGLFQHLLKFWDERKVKANNSGYLNGEDIFSPRDNVAVAAWLFYVGGGSSHWYPSEYCWG
jgi:hypothetical protein